MIGIGTGKLARAVDALRTDFSGRPTELRAFALALVAGVGEGAAALWYEVGMVRDNPYPVRFEVRAGEGADPILLPLIRQLDEEVPWPTVDPRLPPRAWNRSFVLLPTVIDGGRDAMRESRLYRRVWQPAGMEDQLRMVVYHRGEHAGWIGALRRRGDPPFTRADRRRLAPLADAIADALVAARETERAGEPDRAGDVLTRADGRVVFASPAGEAWLAQRDVRARLRAWIRAVDRGDPPSAVLGGVRLRWSRMYGRGATRYLVQLDRPGPVVVHAGFRLSRMQCDVARLAAAGATASEIASMHGVATETVRGQLKQIYRLLDIASRAELARVFADVTPHVEPPTVGALRRASARRSHERRTA
jgi:DNA-binding CsgD family transcriptional regulator